MVTIWDTNNNPVADATVSITWSGVVSGSASGVTGADGTVTFVSNKVKSTGPFTITVNKSKRYFLFHHDLAGNQWFPGGSQ